MRWGHEQEVGLVRAAPAGAQSLWLAPAEPALLWQPAEVALGLLAARWGPPQHPRTKPERGTSEPLL